MPSNCIDLHGGPLYSRRHGAELLQLYSFGDGWYMTDFIWNLIPPSELIASDAPRMFCAGQIVVRKIFGGMVDRVRAPPAAATKATSTEETIKPGLSGLVSTLAIAPADSD